MANYCELPIDEILHETAKAMLVKIDENQFWIPLSQIDKDESDWDAGVLMVSEWFAKKEGLI